MWLNDFRNVTLEVNSHHSRGLGNKGFLMKVHFLRSACVTYNSLWWKWHKTYKIVQTTNSSLSKVSLQLNPEAALLQVRFAQGVQWLSAWTCISSVSDFCGLPQRLQNQAPHSGYPSRAMLSPIGKKMLPSCHNSHSYTTQLRKGASYSQKTSKNLTLFY